jgi:hypothetical protein
MERRRSQRIKSIKKCSCYDSDSNSHDHVNKIMKQNSNSTNSCEVISNLLLLEDLRFHIFTFVPVNCLINSARYVCKHWAATISNSQFIEAYEHHAHSKPGLYIVNRTTHGNSYFLELKDDVNGQIVKTDLGTPQEMGHLISTCDGLLLLFSNIDERYFVVNPILKFWLRIPNFPAFRSYILVRGRCAIARVPHTSEFKLFHMDFFQTSDALWNVIYMLRIGIDNSWKEIARKQTFPNSKFLMLRLFIGGNDIYWITEKEVIVMDVDKESIIREYPHPHLPNDVFIKYLWMKNRLSCIAYKESYRTYQVFILDFNLGKWSLYHEMGPFDYVAACGQQLNILLVKFRFWINDQVIFKVVLHQNSARNSYLNPKNIHFGYNVKTKQLTKIEGIDVGAYEVWLHTNSLVSLPSTAT